MKQIKKTLIGHVNKFDSDADETIINQQVENYELFLDLEEDLCQDNNLTNLQGIEKEVSISFSLPIFIKIGDEHSFRKITGKRNRVLKGNYIKTALFIFRMTAIMMSL